LQNFAKYGVVIGFVIFILTCFTYSHSALAECINGNGRVVMLNIDRLTLNDIDKMLVLKNILKKGGVGLLNTKTANGRSTENVCVTVGCGVPMASGNSAQYAFGTDEEYKGEKTSIKYQRRTGWVPPKSSVLQLDIAQLKNISKSSSYTALPGALGKILEDKGYNTVVLGNSDYGDKVFRPAVTIAMNDKGIVRYGKIGKELLIKDLDFPGTIRTDYEKLLAVFDSYLNIGDFFVIDVGDLTRLEQSGAQVMPNVMIRQREKTLLRTDKFIGELLERLNFKSDLLIIFAPGASVTAKKGDMLTPIIFNGHNIKKGYLTSGTTRRSGVITATDLAPTILGYFNIKKPFYMIGQIVKTVPGENSLENLKNINNRMVVIYNARPPLIKGYVILYLLFLLISLYLIFFFRSGAKFLKPFLILMMSIPVSFLFIPLLPWTSFGSLFASLVLISLMITIGSILTNRFWYLGPFTFISIFTAISIIIDLFCGAPLQKQSVFGYDAIAGARFYGLGNEYMGILIGAVIMGTTLFMSAFARHKNLTLYGAVIFFVVCLYSIAAPHLGTNVGGTIAASSGFLVTLLLLSEVKLTRRIIMYITSAIGLLLLLLIAVDRGHDPAQQSHICRNARLILSGGIEEAVNIVYRKLEVNLRLIKYTIWSRFFLASLCSLALLFYRPVGIMRIIRREYPFLFKGFAGAIVGSIVALIFNDSGIVAAATSMIFIASPLIYLVLFEYEKR